MPFAIRGEITGLKECVATLAHLKAGVRTRVVRRAVTICARILAKAAKQRAPKESGLLRKSIASKVKTYPGGGVVAIIGPRSDAKFKQRVTRKRGKWFPAEVYSNPVKYAHLVELGHGGPAAAPARPFLAPALAASQGAVQSAFARAVREGLEKEAAKAAKGK